MSESLLKLFSNPIIFPLFLATILASIASSIMGSYVVIKKVSSISGSISHSILGGIGLFIWLKYQFNIPLNPIYGAFLAAFICSFLLGWLHLKHSQKEDATIATIWTTGMGLGVIFISLTPSFHGHFTHFLFGDILKIQESTLFILLVFDILLIFLVFIFYKQFLLICFDEESAILQNIKVKSFYILLFSLISISIVILVQIVGIILSIALLIIPPTISKIFTKKLISIMVFSFFICFLFTFLGSLLSLLLKLPAGAICSLLSSFFYVLVLLFKRKPFNLVK